MSQTGPENKEDAINKKVASRDFTPNSQGRDRAK
jgi:hypothetical protein